ncbi:hypothetical protein EVAR_62136_1 [Eumeta japonica]|uniref:Uncharacterized protein n=1 Tax=Eumeta variegata TaxID=151549 RepID=A0A4C1ZJC6_EUMVA|nr:hypothetical protein EVAR_62136_1 [Eumeta japonica]
MFEIQYSSDENGSRGTQKLRARDHFKSCLRTTLPAFVPSSPERAAPAPAPRPREHEQLPPSAGAWRMAPERAPGRPVLTIATFKLHLDGEADSRVSGRLHAACYRSEHRRTTLCQTKCEIRHFSTAVIPQSARCDTSEEQVHGLTRRDREAYTSTSIYGWPAVNPAGGFDLRRVRLRRFRDDDGEVTTGGDCLVCACVDRSRKATVLPASRPGYDQTVDFRHFVCPPVMGHDSYTVSTVDDRKTDNRLCPGKCRDCTQILTLATKLGHPTPRRRLHRLARQQIDCE